MLPRRRRLARAFIFEKERNVEGDGISGLKEEKVRAE
jgi:hypothetical protein